MIKLISFVKRKPGTDVDEFHRHWRDTHGPLIREVMGKHIVRYEQNHRLATDYERGEPEFDGVAEIWFASREAFDGFLSDPAYLERVFPDEQAFLEIAEMPWILTEDSEVVVDGPTAAQG